MSQLKALLLARLATSRAALWRELLAIDKDTLVTQPITGDWTAKDLLAHVAAWDDMHADRVELILAGRLGELQRSDRDALNERIFHEREDWPLDRVVTATQEARSRFLALLAPLTWEDIAREHRTPAGETVSIRFLAERRAQHDDMHAAEFRAWEAEAEPEETPGPKSVLAAGLDSARSALLAWGELIPESQYASLPVCGVWVWQDVLGHIADWEMFSVRGLEAMAKGQPGGTDWDDEEGRWNQAHAEQRRGEPLAQSWQDFAQARERLLEILAGFDDRSLAREANTDVEDLDTYYYWFSTCFAHDFEHAASLSQTLPGMELGAEGAPAAVRSRGMPAKISLEDKFGLFSDQWSPKIVAELNGQYVKLARLQGEFVWHRHAAEDELFVVIDGRLTIKFRDGELTLDAGEMVVVPAGVEHLPVAEQETLVMLLEPKTTLNTGNVRDEHTVEQPDWI